MAAVLHALEAEAGAGAEEGGGPELDVAMEGGDVGGGGGDDGAQPGVDDEAADAIATAFTTALRQYAIVVELAGSVSVYDPLQSRQHGGGDGDPAQAPGVKVRHDGLFVKTVTVGNFTLADLQRHHWPSLASVARSAVAALVTKQEGGKLDAVAAKLAARAEKLEASGVTVGAMQEALRVCASTPGRGTTSIGLQEVAVEGGKQQRDVLFGGGPEQVKAIYADRSRMIVHVVHRAAQLQHLRRHCPLPDGTGKTTVEPTPLPITGVTPPGLPSYSAIQAACSLQHHAALTSTMPPPLGAGLPTSHHSEVTAIAKYVKRGADGSSLAVSTRPLAAAVIDLLSLLAVVVRVVEALGVCEEKLTPSSSPTTDLTFSTAASDITREASQCSVFVPYASARAVASSALAVIDAAKQAAGASSLEAALADPALVASAASCSVSPKQLFIHAALAARLLRYTTDLDFVDRMCGTRAPAGGVELALLAPLWRAVYRAERAFMVECWTDGSEWEKHKSMAVCALIFPTLRSLRPEATDAVAALWKQLRRAHTLLFHVGDSSVNAAYLHRTIERRLMASLASGSGGASEAGMHRVAYTPRNGGGPTLSLEVSTFVTFVGDTPAACTLAGIQQQGPFSNPQIRCDVGGAFDALRLMREGTYRSLADTERTLRVLHAAGVLAVRNEAIADRVDVAAMPLAQVKRVARKLREEFGADVVAPLPDETAPAPVWRKYLRAALGGVNAGHILTFNQPVEVSSASGHGWPAAFVIGGYSHAFGKLPLKIIRQVLLHWAGDKGPTLEARINEVTGGKSKDNTSFAENMRIVSTGGLTAIFGATTEERAASLPKASPTQRDQAFQVLEWLGDVYRAQQQSLEEATSELQRLEFIGLVMRLAAGIHALFPVPKVHGSGAKTVQGALYGHYWIYLVFAPAVIRLLPGCVFDELRFERAFKDVHAIEDDTGSNGSHGRMAELAAQLGIQSWAQSIARSAYGRTDPARAATSAVQSELNRHRSTHGQRVAFPDWTQTPFLAHLLTRFTASNLVAGQFAMSGNSLELCCGASDPVTIPVTYSPSNMTPARVDEEERKFRPDALQKLLELVPAPVAQRMRLVEDKPQLLAMGDPAELRLLGGAALHAAPPPPVVDSSDADEDDHYDDVCELDAADEVEGVAGAAGDEATHADGDAAGEGDGGDVPMDGGDAAGAHGGGEAIVDVTLGHEAVVDAAAAAAAATDATDSDAPAAFEAAAARPRAAPVVVEVNGFVLARAEAGRLSVEPVDPLVRSRTKYALVAALSIVASAGPPRDAKATNECAEAFWSCYVDMRAAQAAEKAGKAPPSSGTLATAVARLEPARNALTAALSRLDEHLSQELTFTLATKVRRGDAASSIHCIVQGEPSPSPSAAAAAAQPAPCTVILLKRSELSSEQTIAALGVLRSLLNNIRSAYELWLPGDAAAAAVRHLVEVDEAAHAKSAQASQQALKALVLSGTTTILPHHLRAAVPAAAKPKATAASKLLEGATSEEAELAALAPQVVAAERAVKQCLRNVELATAALNAAKESFAKLRAAVKAAGARGGGGGGGGGGGSGDEGGGEGGGEVGRQRSKRRRFKSPGSES